MKQIFTVVFILFSSILFSQIILNLDYTIEKIDSSDELTNFQLIENDDLIAGFNNENIYRIVNYGCDGDTLYTFSVNKFDNEDLEKMKIFSFDGNNYLITCSNFDYWSDPELQNRILIRIFEMENFTEVVSFNFDNNCYGWLDNDYPTVNFIEINNQQDNAQIFVGYNEGWCEGYAVDPWCYEKSYIAKFNFSQSEIQLLEILPNVGLELQLIESNNNFISLGFVHDFGGLEAPYSYWDYYIKVFDNLTPASIETISNIDYYKRDFTILTDGFYNSNSMGHLIYIRPEEPIADLINYSIDLSEVLWEREEAESGMNKITASTEISTNEGNHFLLYFRYHLYKLIDRISGNTILNDEILFPINKILRKSNDELLFVSFIQDIFNVYSLDGEIQVSADNNQLSITNIEMSNYPNPFNPSTTISFSIQNNSKIELSIFNIKGQRIKTLTQNVLTKGSHSLIWDGDDESGKSVSSGIYFYKLNVNGKNEAVKKCLLLK